MGTACYVCVGLVVCSVQAVDAKLGSLSHETGVATQLTAKWTGTVLTSWREVLLERLIFTKLSKEIPHLV